MDVRIAVMLVAGMLAGPGTSAAAAASKNQTSTTRFITDVSRYMTVAIQSRTQIAAAVDGFVRDVNASCPGVVANAPPFSTGTAAQNQAEGALNAEAQTEVVVIASTPLRSATAKLASELSRLHWSSRTISRMVARYVRATTKSLQIVAPDVCSDARTMAADGYAITPPDEQRYLSQVTSISKLSPAALAQDMKTFEAPPERARVKTLSRQGVRLEMIGFGITLSAASKVVATLGLRGLPTP